MPFDNYIWNLTTYLNYLSIDDDLCFGFSKLDDILLNDTSFGIKIYSSRIGDFNLSDHGKVEVYMPYLGTAVSQVSHFPYKCSFMIHLFLVQCLQQRLKHCMRGFKIIFCLRAMCVSEVWILLVSILP